jgi:hypothetical protein
MLHPICQLYQQYLFPYSINGKHTTGRSLRSRHRLLPQGSEGQTLTQSHSREVRRRQRKRIQRDQGVTEQINRQQTLRIQRIK